MVLLYLWNPYIRKIKTVTGTTLTVKERDPFKSDIGFAYHSQNNDYKIVRVVLCQKQNVIEAEVYTLSTDMWRTAEVWLELLRRFGTEDFIFSRVGSQNPFVNGALHWSIHENYRYWYL